MLLNIFFRYIVVFVELINFIIEKCSESIGIIFTLYFFAVLLIKFQPQITDSLFAIKTFLLFLII